MSMSLMSAIFRIDFKKPILKFVLIAMADNATDEGYCFPSMATIAKKCSISRRSVMRSINELAALGYLKSENRFHESGRKTSNEYWIILEGMGQSVTYVCDTVSHTHGTQCHISKDNHQKEPSKRILADRSADTQVGLILVNYNQEKFDEFWKYYPSKIKKQMCIKIFQKLAPDNELFREMMYGLRRYVDQVEKERATGFAERQYQHPSTWLNNRGWEDEFENPSASASERKSQGYCQIQPCGRKAFHLYGGRTLCDSHFQQCSK